MIFGWLPVSNIVYSQLQCGDKFSPLPLFINTRLSALLCLDCHVLLIPKHAEGHIRTRHRGQQTGPWKVKLCSALGDCLQSGQLSSNNELPTLPTVPAPPYLGVETPEIGFQCKITEDCGLWFRSIRSFKGHRLVVHPGVLPTPTNMGPKTLIQIVTHSPGHLSAVPILSGSPTPTPEHASAHSSLPVEYLEQIERNIAPPPSVLTSDMDPRHLVSWLYQTRWYTYVEQKEPQQLIKFAALPCKPSDCYYRLRFHVLCYIKLGYHRIPFTSPFI